MSDRGGAERERRRQGARIDGLEDEVELLRVAKHEHANRLTAHGNWIEVLRGQKLDERIKSLEGWRQWVLGGAAAVSAIVSLLGGWIGKHLLP